jgi:hypothetical protein
MLPLYCMCQAKERRISQAYQVCPAALRSGPEMDLHVRLAPQEDLDRQRLGLRPDMHLQKARLWRMKDQHAIVLRRCRQEQWLPIAAKRGEEAQLQRLVFLVERPVVDRRSRMGLPFHPSWCGPHKRHVIWPRADGRHARLPLPGAFDRRQEGCPTLRCGWLYPCVSSPGKRRKEEHKTVQDERRDGTPAPLAYRGHARVD